MNLRWIIAGIGALGLGLAAIPFLPAGTQTAGKALASCDAKAGVADYDFTLKDAQGKDVRLSDYKGKVVMMNFFATWCGPCKYEIPVFVELQEQYRDQGVAFIGVQIEDDPQLLPAFAAEYKVNYPMLVANDRTDFQEAFGPFWGIPVTVMIQRDGTICKRHSGLASKAQFEQDIKALL